MPLVIVKRDPEKVSDKKIAILSRALPAIVAKALSTGKGTKGELASGKIQVWVQDVGQFDRNVPEIGIIILAQLYPAIEKNLDHRRKEIENSVAAILFRSNDGFVLVLLVKKGSFGEFKKI